MTTKAIPRLAQQQAAFVGHLRDPCAVPLAAGLDARRMAVYQRLLHNNVRSLLANALPVCAQLLGADTFATLVRRYYVGHRCRNPLFTGMTQEFVQWLQDQPALPHPALAELAHYEWVETALLQHEADPLPRALIEDPLSSALGLSPLAWPFCYAWPVHTLGEADGSRAVPAEPTTLLLRRDQHGQVRFALLSPLAFLLLDALATRPGRSGREYLADLATLQGLDCDALLPAGAAVLAQFVHLGVVGAAPVPHPKERPRA